MSSNHEHEDLDLLLSLDDRVPETPPASPSPLDVDDDAVSYKHREKPDMSVFRDAVQDCLHSQPSNPNPNPKSITKPLTDDPQLDKFSGLRITNQCLTPAELRESVQDIRFVRLPVIKNLVNGDSFSGSWVTVGVLTEKGIQKTSSNGKSYCIWKIGSLDENTISLFLFGNAYQRNCQEKEGTVFALFNSTVRKDAKGNGFSLSIYSPNQIMKMGTSVDYGVCKGKRADGMSCTLAINKRQGTYCKYHKSKSSEKYSTVRTELKGGRNLRTAFRPRDYLKSEGIYLVDPLADKTNLKKSKPVKLLSVDGIRKALSNAGKVTTASHSQGIRFLSEVAGKFDPKMMKKEPKTPNDQSKCTTKRKSSSVNMGYSSVIRNQQLDVKKAKTERQVFVDKATKSTGKMIELDLISSDEDF
ncbi:protein MCM10 homolog isoform X1 [Medicago truncatula]|uniref:protein MCM10 homolog isoform X1 n=1 Tax=Medicago truncatula TaxID=3880 RepID=UPI000D2F2CEF|nr:protein MCM10 homolog isoform X1 [Medicago truncatula]